MGIVKDACNALPDALDAVVNWINNKVFTEVEKRLLRPVLNFIGVIFTEMMRGINTKIAETINIINTFTGTVMNDVDSTYTTLMTLTKVMTRINGGDMLYYLAMKLVPFITRVWPFPLTITQAVTITIFIIVMFFVSLTYMFLKAMF